MTNSVNAEYVLRKKSKKHIAQGVSIFMGLIVLLELFYSASYVSYTYLNESNGFMTFAIVLANMFSTPIFAPPITWAWLGEVLWVFARCFLILDAVVASILVASIRKRGNFKGVEHGSARWANEDELKSLCDEGNCIPCADGLYLNEEVRDDEGRKMITHLNEVVIGDTGAGKSFRKIIPDILQMVGSYVVTDTKGALFAQLHNVLVRHGYNVRVLNLLDLKNGNTFNPLAYITSNDEVQRLVNGFIENTKGENEVTSDPFWQQMAATLISAVVYYLIGNDKEDRTMCRVFDLINGLSVDAKGDIENHCELETIMRELEVKDRFNPAVVHYRSFRQSRGNTTTSILSTCLARMGLWANESVRILTGSDEMNIDELADGKTVIFVIIPDNNNSYKVIENMFISTALTRLSWLADMQYHGKLPNLVSFEMDEFGNLGALPDFGTLVPTIRSRNIRSMCVIQSIQMLEKNYEKDYKTILSNSHWLYLGTNDGDTNKLVVEKLGKTTIDEESATRNVGMQGGGSEQDRSMGRELLMADELTTISGKCIVFIRRFHPFFLPVFNTEAHPLYSEIGHPRELLKEGEVDNNVDIEVIYAPLAAQHRAAYEQYKRARGGAIDRAEGDFLVPINKKGGGDKSGANKPTGGNKGGGSGGEAETKSGGQEISEDAFNAATGAEVTQDSFRTKIRLGAK